MNEYGLTAKCREWFKKQPDMWWLKVHGHDGQRAGVPDFLLCVRGRFLGLELKSPEATGKDAEPSPLQRVQMGMIRRAGGVTECCQTLEEVKAVVEAIRAELPGWGTVVPVNKD